MPKVTGLTDEEMQKLNDTIEPLLHQGMAKIEPYVTNKAERVAFNLAEMAVKTAEHLPLARRLGVLVDGTNKLLPKLTKYFNEQSIADFVPPELKTQEVADLCEKAGAKPLADLLRKVAAPATASADASSTSQAVSSAKSLASSSTAAVTTGPKISPVDLRIAPTPTIPAGPGGR